MTDPNKNEHFNRMASQHLDAAYNLARWLTQNAQDAEDVVQESLLKALRYFEGFKGGDGRAWLLAIVRNTSYTWLQSNKDLRMESFDEDGGHGEFHRQFNQAVSLKSDPEQLVQQHKNRILIDTAIECLPFEFREVLVLREIENCSYKEIAGITGIPIGTVMSRLARARGLMRDMLAQHFTTESAP